MEPLPKERSDLGDDGPAARAVPVAAMEPLPKERSDLWFSAGRNRDLPIWPQWSRSRRSGATPPHPVPALRTRLAAMEPLPKERSDRPAPHVSRAPAVRHGRNGAAPEGAERRLAKNGPSDLRRYTRSRAPARPSRYLRPLWSCQDAKNSPDQHASAHRDRTHHQSARGQETSDNDRARHRKLLMMSEEQEPA